MLSYKNIMHNIYLLSQMCGVLYDNYVLRMVTDDLLLQRKKFLITKITQSNTVYYLFNTVNIKL